MWSVIKCKLFPIAIHRLNEPTSRRRYIHSMWCNLRKITAFSWDVKLFLSHKCGLFYQCDNFFFLSNGSCFIKYILSELFLSCLFASTRHWPSFQRFSTYLYLLLKLIWNEFVKYLNKKIRVCSYKTAN